MSNTGVTGRVVDELGVGIAGVRVVVLDKDGLFGDTALGSVETSATGDFAVSYPPGAYGLEANPDIVVRVQDLVGRSLLQTPVREDTTDPVLALGPLVVPRNVAKGLATALGTGAATMLSDGNDIEFLVDNEDAWASLTDAIRNADRSVHMGQLTIDATPSGSSEEHGPRLFTEFLTLVPQAVGTRPEQELMAAARRGVTVRVLLNDFRMFFAIPVLGALTFPNYPVDTAARLAELFADAMPPAPVELRPAPMPLVTPMHAKVTIIDGTVAYLVGSPLVQEYFDDAVHALRNGKRGWKHVIDTLGSPAHDVTARITGPAVADLDRTFCLLWNQDRPVGSPEVVPAAPPPPRPANLRMQVNRSLRGEERYDAAPQGEAGIYESYLRAIATAEDYIYLENQYLTCAEIVDALVAAVQAKPALQVILAVNPKVDIPFYSSWQRVQLERLLTGLTPAQRDRVGVFTVWTHEPPPPGENAGRIVHIYLHSKVAIVDDRWLTVGSANLDSVGLTSSQHMEVISRILWGLPALINALTGDEIDFANQRSAEANVAVFSADGAPNEAAVRLRRRLWAEHLGLVDGAGAPNPDDPLLTDRPVDGWLRRWRDAAKTKLDGLLTEPTRPRGPRVLPLPHTDGVVPHVIGGPAVYLHRLGVDMTRLRVAKDVGSFSFHDGRWIDG